MQGESQKNHKMRFYIDTYGCQMNKYDSEIVTGILTSSGFIHTQKSNEAEIILINTCSVRDHAERRALGRLGSLSSWKHSSPYRKLGIIGCMAQRMQEELLSLHPHVDFIVGPDSYNNLPSILSNGIYGPCIDTKLNEDETYRSVKPNRKSGICGWVAITRGCNNFCSYCIVPYTRGRERSRPAHEILKEIIEMASLGFREVTLLGQNVNSYNNGNHSFASLLALCADVQGILRIRFMTSHPKDLTEEILHTMASYPKICNHIHLPLQSGSDRILALMNRKYTRNNILNLIMDIRNLIPVVAITTDVIVGFPGETESDFQDTYNLIKTVRFDDAFTYHYSPRPGTRAALIKETLSQQDKLNRLDQIIRLQRRITSEKKNNMIGQTVEVLAEGVSKQSTQEWMGKTSTNHVIIFPKEKSKLGELVQVRIETCKGATLRGSIVHTETDASTPKPWRKPCGS